MIVRETGSSIVRLEDGSIQVHFSIRFRPRHVWIFLAIAGVPVLITATALTQDMKLLLLDGLIGLIQILITKDKC